MMSPRYFDAHTHDTSAVDALISVAPDFIPAEGHYYSVGIHPWDTEGLLPADWPAMLARRGADSDVLAIGETGLDKLKGAPLQRQMDVLREHIAVSERVGKPLILHIVRAFPEIIRLKAEIKPVQPWIVHGFRGKPELARELVRHGFYLSMGEKFNQDSALAVPPGRLLAETDESTLTIDEIASRIPNLDSSLAFTIFGIDNRNTLRNADKV